MYNDVVLSFSFMNSKYSKANDFVFHSIIMYYSVCVMRSGFLLISFWGHTWDAQKLLLVLHLAITPGSVWGTLWNDKDQTQTSCMQGKCQNIYSTIILALGLEFYERLHISL